MSCHPTVAISGDASPRLSPLTVQVIKVDALVRLLATSAHDGLAWQHYMRQLLAASDTAVEMTRSDA